MGEMKSQTMTAAMAAAIMEDIQVLVDRLEAVNGSTKDHGDLMLSSMANAQKHISLATRELSATNNEIYNKLATSLTETQELRREMRSLVVENRNLSRRFFIMSVLFIFMTSGVALLSFWLLLKGG